MSKRRLVIFVSVLGACLAMALIGGARLAKAQDYVPDYVTYTVYVLQNNQPYSGTADIHIRLYGTSTPDQNSTTYWSRYFDNVQVVDGYATLRLEGQNYEDYGGANRYLKVYVAIPPCRPNCEYNDNEYEELPAQQVGAVPYAMKAYETYGYKYVVTVAKEGGDYTSVYDAVQSISDASSSKPYLVLVYPGIYSETQTIDVPSWVTIKGYGKYNTYIKNFSTDKTLRLNDNTSVGYLTVENRYTGGNSSYAVYLDPDAKPVYLYHMAAYAYGQENSYGIYAVSNSNSIELHLDYVYAYGIGKGNDPGSNYGLYVKEEDNSPGDYVVKVYVKNSKLYGRYGQYAYGIYNYAGWIDVYYSHVKGEKATDYNYGVYNYLGAWIKLYKGYYYGYYGEGYGQRCYGVWNERAALEAYYAYVYGYECDQYNYGLYNYYDSGAGDSTVKAKYAYFKGYKGQDAWGIYNYGSNATYHGDYVYGYAEQTSGTSYGFYNTEGAQAWFYYGYYWGYKGDVCYGVFNDQSTSNKLKAEYVTAYGKYCDTKNYGLYNKNNEANLYGGTYYAEAESTGDNSQFCYGIWTGGDSGNNYKGWVNAYDSLAYAKNCYWNYGVYVQDYGWLHGYGGTYYAYGGENTYGAYCKDEMSEVYAVDISGAGKEGSTNNYGYYGTDGCHSKLAGGTWLAKGGSSGVDSYGIYCSGSSTECENERISAWAKEGSDDNYGYYNTNDATSYLDLCVVAGYPDGGGSNYGVYTNANDGKVYAAYCKFDGGYKNAANDDTDMKCIGNWDENYDAVANCNVN